MKTFLTRYFLLSSLLLFGASLHAQKHYIVGYVDSIGRQEFKMNISVKDADVSGILVMKVDSVGGIKCALMNEFGISALNFSVSTDRKQVELVNVISFLDKWYIRKVLKSDLEYLFSATKEDLDKENHSKLIRRDDTSVILENKKYNITYTLEELKDKDDEVAQ